MKTFVLATTVLLALAEPAFAKKLLILTDQPSAAKAHEIEALIRTTVPFKLLKSTEFTVETRVVDPKTHPIKCAPKVIKYTEAQIYSLQYWSKQSGIPISDKQLELYRKGYTIDRLVECDKTELAALGAQYQADRLMFVHDSKWEGGSGGDIPIILAGSRAGIGMHEWLHGYGLADEYAYAREEAPFYCKQHQWVNVAIFNEEPPYRSSDDVRTKHHDQIPFLQYLSPHATLITNDHLGSPKAGQLGIFPSKTCTNVTPLLQSWKSSSNPTIMEDPMSTYIPKPYWPAILSGIGVSRARVSSLMRTAVEPTWSKFEQSPGNPPPAGI